MPRTGYGGNGDADVDITKKKNVTGNSDSIVILEENNGYRSNLSSGVSEMTEAASICMAEAMNSIWVN